MREKRRSGIRPLPRTMHFKYPDGKHLRGKVVEEICHERNYPHGEYLFVVQKCKIEGQMPYDVRFGYYRRETGKKRWVWGSQTTFQSDKATVEKVIRKAIKAGLISV